MRGDELTVSDVIDYRGHPATVVETWVDQADAPVRSAPVGCIIEWVDEQGNLPRTRLVWPELTWDEQRRPDAGGLTDAEVLAQLSTDLDALPVTLVV